jgi:hypothetical protein
LEDAGVSDAALLVAKADVAGDVNSHPDANASGPETPLSSTFLLDAATSSSKDALVGAAGPPLLEDAGVSDAALVVAKADVAGDVNSHPDENASGPETPLASTFLLDAAISSSKGALVGAAGPPLLEDTGVSDAALVVAKADVAGDVNSHPDANVSGPETPLSSAFLVNDAIASSKVPPSVDTACPSLLEDASISDLSLFGAKANVAGNVSSRTDENISAPVTPLASAFVVKAAIVPSEIDSIVDAAEEERVALSGAKADAAVDVDFHPEAANVSAPGTPFADVGSSSIVDIQEVDTQKNEVALASALSFFAPAAAVSSNSSEQGVSGTRLKILDKRSTDGIIWYYVQNSNRLRWIKLDNPSEDMKHAVQQYETLKGPISPNIDDVLSSKEASGSSAEEDGALSAPSSTAKRGRRSKRVESQPLAKRRAVILPDVDVSPEKKVRSKRKIVEESAKQKRPAKMGKTASFSALSYSRDVKSCIIIIFLDNF